MGVAVSSTVGVGVALGGTGISVGVCENVQVGEKIHVGVDVKVQVGVNDGVCAGVGVETYSPRVMRSR